jgi:glycerol 2-dehydrogenase (NADP+)
MEEEEQVEESVVHALQSGYRLIDTAQLYGTEPLIGRAIRKSGVPRSEICLVTKFWGEWHHDPAEALRISLKELDTDYVDVFLMHWPWATTPDKKLVYKHESPTIVETWKMMEKLVGPKCKAIGVSNFTPKLLDELLEVATIVPAVNQIELHPFNPHPVMVPYCQEKGIHLMAWRYVRMHLEVLATLL